MLTVLPLFSTIVSFVFAAAVFAQWVSRRKAHQLVWTLGLLAYGIGAGTEYVTVGGQWSDLVYRLWYLFGAVLVAAYLGMGTVYLLSRQNKKVAHIVMAILALASLYAIFKVFTAPVNLAAVLNPTRFTGEAMPGDVRLLTPLFNVFGTITLAGGALYSAWIFWRKRIMPQRMVSCVLIAVGAIFPAIGGTSLRLGNPNLFFLMEFLGVAVIFIGFLANSEIVATRLTAGTSQAHLQSS
ncbi:MAG: hypothetical protein M1343_09335 [Chloroflexi bacterium]|nr:hypothetical protein [Chloroflexota bacterium]MDA8187299.1 hypothetical protein [Dehalococcoidales bacterium]